MDFELEATTLLAGVVDRVEIVQVAIRPCWQQLPKNPGIRRASTKGKRCNHFMVMISTCRLGVEAFRVRSNWRVAALVLLFPAPATPAR